MSVELGREGLGRRACSDCGTFVTRARLRAGAWLILKPAASSFRLYCPDCLDGRLEECDADVPAFALLADPVRAVKLRPTENAEGSGSLRRLSI